MMWQPQRILSGNLVVTASSVILIISCHVQAYSVIPSRDTIEPNTLTIRCRNSSLDIPNPVFLLNDTNLEDMLRSNGKTVISTTYSLAFGITRELEGDYSCGPDETSTGTPLQIISYPQALQPQDLSPTRLVKIAIDDTAILPPLVSPGKLIQWYYIDWQNAATLQTLASIQGPRARSPVEPPERFSIDPVTFALTISPVRFEDRGSYLGVVGVVDPEGASVGTYRQTELVNITLDVYVPLRLTETLDDKVLTGGFTTYACTVQVYPIPETPITWFHNDVKVKNSLSKYRTEQVVHMGTQELPAVESRLMIFNLESDDSGNVTCVAMSTQENEPPMTNISHLSVLGNFANFKTFITIDGGTILRVFLIKPLAAEVQLFVQYTSTESGEKWNITTSTRYSQTNEIIFFDENAQFQRFKVAVALVSGSVKSQMLQDSNEYDTSMPSMLSQYTAHLYTVIAITLFLLIFVIILVTLVCVSCCLQRNDINDLKKDFRQHIIQQKKNNNAQAGGPPRLPGRCQWFLRLFGKDEETRCVYAEYRELLTSDKSL